MWVGNGVGCRVCGGAMGGWEAGWCGAVRRMRCCFVKGGIGFALVEWKTNDGSLCDT
jgi:hypothetical protein